MTLASKLLELDLSNRASFVIDVLRSGDENAEQRLAAALEEMGAEGTMSVLDALGRARGLHDAEAESALLSLGAGR